ncbi:hypothetical protein EC968_000233 [Mortierella alpina]|nr:hypothetical protein EC968_000233 [Mortierella alpina]
MSDAAVPPPPPLQPGLQATTTATTTSPASSDPDMVHGPLTESNASTRNATTLQGHSPSPSPSLALTPQGSSAGSTPAEAPVSESETGTGTAGTAATPEPQEAPAAPAAPKQVFSLFLTPEQRKKKLEEAEAAKGATKRGRKPKAKAATASTPSSSSSAPAVAPKPAADQKAMIDPNISKSGETHPFFQEVKASQALAASVGEAGSNPATGNNGQARRRYNTKPQEPPFPLSHHQFHGSDTIDALNGVVARLCGLDTASSPAHLVEALTKHDRKPKGVGTLRHDNQRWYSLRSTPDLGITAPIYKLKPRGRDCWAHWGKDKDLKWREWSERNYRLQKPTSRQKDVFNKFGHADEDEFESCRRVATDQKLWHQSWASSLLTSTAGLSIGSAEIPPELRFGELWTEKYRPTVGAEVLGNRGNTEYLTQWLKGLEVSGWTLNPEELTSGAGSTASSKKSTDLVGAQRKRRKRLRRKDYDDLDDFIVEDDLEDIFDDFGDPYEYLGDVDNGLFATPRPLTSFAHLAHGDLPLEGEDLGLMGGAKVLPRKFDIKSNTILLSGPTGSCKTAAVYACAEESGYEVFEVSPGMRRTGKEVLGLVGEMAENHHVHVVPGKTDFKDEIHHIMGGKGHETAAAASPPPVQQAPTQPSTIFSFFQKKQSPSQSHAQMQGEDEIMQEASEIDVVGIDDDDIGQTEQSADSQSQTSSSPGSAKESEHDKADSLANHQDTLSDLYSLLATTNPRQSLILLEEVDILFEDDKGFWASIMTLLSKSKRPVVMTCNDTSKIPAATLKFQEHLEFTKPGLREIHLYLSSICKIEGFICSAEYLTSLIMQCRYDIRRCLMQLQYDSGVIKSRSSSPKSTPSPSSPLSYNGQPRSRDSSPLADSVPVHTGIQHVNGGGPPASPGRRKPQRLLRISANGIIRASTPIMSDDKKSIPSPLQELEQLEIQAQYADVMSMSDSQLRMKPGRVIQCYELDQFEPTKDDTVGQNFVVLKRPSGQDHLFLDQEIASLVEEGCESLYLCMANQYGIANPAVFEDAVKRDDPVRTLAEVFIPMNEVMTRTLRQMQPALEQIMSLHGLRFNLDVTFGAYAPLLRSMIEAEDVNTAVPTGKRTMRSGGHLKRHLNMLSDSERAAMRSTCFPSLARS